jgi:hypothetical protein
MTSAAPMTDRIDAQPASSAGTVDPGGTRPVAQKGTEWNMRFFSR